MNSERVDVFYKAYRYHLAGGVSYNFQFKFFPAKYRLFNKNLPHKRCLKTSFAYGLKFVNIIYKTAAGSSHCICGPKHNRITELFCNSKCIVNRVRNFRSCHLDSEGIHKFLELYPVFSTLYGIRLDSDDFHSVFVKHARLVQLRAKIQSCLPAQVRKKSVRTLLLNDLRKSLDIKRLYISNIRCCRVGHNRCRIGVYENYLVPQLFKRLARLGSGIIELTRLPYYYRSASNYQNLVDIISLFHNTHFFSLLLSLGTITQLIISATM